MKIAVDAMGGDYAPQAVVEGVVQAVKECNIDTEIILVGNQQRINDELKRLKAVNLPGISILHASQVIDMDEIPVLAIRKKKDSSLLKAVSLVKDGNADAFISAGNTGAIVAATKIKWRSLQGVERPAIAVIMPSPSGVFLLLDAGATPDCKPVHLMQFGIMGSAYAEHVLGIKNPKVGLLSFGTEEMKGTNLTKEAYRLLQNVKDKINFIGNIEGNDLFTDKVDVVVCEGFMGNVILKVCESLAGALQYIVKEEIMKDFWAKVGALMARPAFKKIGKKMHYAEYGGAPLLGVNGVCIKSHGRSSAMAIKNAIGVARYMVKQEVNKYIINTITATG